MAHAQRAQVGGDGLACALAEHLFQVALVDARAARQPGNCQRLAPLGMQDVQGLVHGALPVAGGAGGGRRGRCAVSRQQLVP